jgi:hypothetical protein
VGVHGFGVSFEENLPVRHPHNDWPLLFGLLPISAKRSVASGRSCHCLQDISLARVAGLSKQFVKLSEKAGNHGRPEHGIRIGESRADALVAQASWPKVSAEVSTTSVPALIRAQC